MPTPLPSSFASAAAGNTQDPNRRGDGTSGEWYANIALSSPHCWWLNRLALVLLHAHTGQCPKLHTLDPNLCPGLETA